MAETKFLVRAKGVWPVDEWWPVQNTVEDVGAQHWLLFPYPLPKFYHIWPNPPYFYGQTLKTPETRQNPTGTLNEMVEHYKDPGGKPANGYSCAGSSCCLSASICGPGESVDRPGYFYLPSISIQTVVACQGFAGIRNVSPTAGVSVV